MEIYFLKKVLDYFNFGPSFKKMDSTIAKWNRVMHSTERGFI